jgi:hypothetical protein
MRWMLVFVLACVIFSGLQDWLRRFGLGRLPGDFSFRIGGREIHVPLGSALVFSTLAMLLGRSL